MPFRSRLLAGKDSILFLFPSFLPLQPLGKKGFEYNPWLQGLDWLKTRVPNRFALKGNSHAISNHTGWAFKWWAGDGKGERAREKERKTEYVWGRRGTPLALCSKDFSVSTAKSTVNNIIWCCRTNSIWNEAESPATQALHRKPLMNFGKTLDSQWCISALN